MLGVSKLTGISPIKSLTKATNYLKNMVSSPQISTIAAGETV
ncbi:hypothetical protein [Spiroplasma phoeniceum]|nr:hypothetical protein [Spiroplasma phoeniceum]